MLEQQQVEFRAVVGGPEVRLVGRRFGDHLLQDEALPRGADARVRQEGVHRPDADQVVVEPGVAKVDLGTLDLPLAQVLAPRTQLPDEEQMLQQVDVAPDRSLGDFERRRQLGHVEYPAVAVREHGQQPVKRRHAQRGAELRQVPLHERAQERLPPGHAVGIRAGQERQREAAPEPEFLHSPDADLVDAEAAEFDVLDAAGQRFGALAQQVRTRTAEHEEARRVVVAVDQDPQDRKQIGPALHFVDDDQASQILKGRPRIVEPGQTDRILQVEVVRRVGGHELPRQGRLAALARPDERDDGKTRQRRRNRVLRRAGNEVLRH